MLILSANHATSWQRFALFFALCGLVSLIVAKYRNRKLSGFVVPVLITVAMWMMVELFFFIKQTYFNARHGGIAQSVKLSVLQGSVEGEDVNMPDTIIGYKRIPGQIVKEVYTYGDYKKVSVYSTDSLSRRITPFYGKDTAAKRYALFFGCSVTYGSYVSDSETFPAYVCKYDTALVGYNYGMSGYGTQQMTAMLENGHLRGEIPQKDGFAIYGYITPHVNRVIGDMYTFNKWGSEMPYYYLDNDTPRRKGNFTTGRLWVARLFKLLRKSYVVNYYKLNLPTRLSDRHYYLTAKLIERAYVLYKKQFQNDNFYVLLRPGSDTIMRGYLRKLHIKYLDYSAMVIDAQKGTVPGDGHPTAYHYDTLASRFVKELVAGKPAL